jgi:nitronate monooxygenase
MPPALYLHYSMEKFKIRVGEHEFSFPLIQGGMGVGVSLSGLASAVAISGGVGIIAAAGIGMMEALSLGTRANKADPLALSVEIARAKELAPGGLIGANIMTAMSYYDELVRSAIEAKADLIISGAGLPLNLPGIKSDYPTSATALVPIISSGKAASLITRRWQRDYSYTPDAFVVEGPLAGGHLGFKVSEIDDPDYSLERIVPEVISALEPFGRIPVFAAGGIWDGADAARFMRAGAAGVQMATRFVATEECDAAPEFKEAYIRARETVIISSPVGMPARAITNPFLAAMEAGERRPVRCPYHCIITCKPKETPYCIAEALVTSKLGNTNDGLIFAGANVAKVHEITTVPRIMDEIAEALEDAKLGVA